MWGFKCSGIWHHVMRVVPDVSRDHVAFIFNILGLRIIEDNGSMILWKARDCSPNDTASYPRRHEPSPTPHWEPPPMWIVCAEYYWFFCKDYLRFHMPLCIILNWKYLIWANKMSPQFHHTEVLVTIVFRLDVLM